MTCEEESDHPSLDERNGKTRYKKSITAPNHQVTNHQVSEDASAFDENPDRKKKNKDVAKIIGGMTILAGLTGNNKTTNHG